MKQSRSLKINSQYIYTKSVDTTRSRPHTNRIPYINLIRHNNTFTKKNPSSRWLTISYITCIDIYNYMYILSNPNTISGLQVKCYLTYTTVDATARAADSKTQATNLSPQSHKLSLAELLCNGAISPSGCGLPEILYL